MIGILVVEGILDSMEWWWCLPNGIGLQGLEMTGEPVLVVLVEQCYCCSHWLAQNYKVPLIMVFLVVDEGLEPVSELADVLMIVS